MLKFNYVIMLVILCGGMHSINGEALQCQFKDVFYFGAFGSLYSCMVNSLDNSFDNVAIDGYTGVHKASKNDKDVKGIWIDYKNTKFIPHGLGSISSLSALLIDSSQLVEIRSKDFQGMQNLEYLSLDNNKLTSVPSNTFSFLPQLKFIYLNFNQLSEVPSGLFTNNVNLEEIQLFGNHIKFLGTGVFGGLKKLNIVDLQANICEINQSFNGTIEIEELKNQLNSKCKNPNDPREIIIKLKEQNEELIQEKEALGKEKNALKKNYDALKSELSAAMKLHQRNEIELIKLRDDLKKEQLENIKVKNESDNLMKTRDAMKMELINKTTEINELMKEKETLLKEKDVKLNEFIGMNAMKEMMEQLLKASQDHQKECKDIINLRAELSLAKDQQRTAQDENDQLKKDFTSAKETIDHKLPKNEQTIIDLNKEVMELKNQRQQERNTYMGLRTKLMKTKQQLATCEINERSLI